MRGNFHESSVKIEGPSSLPHMLLDSFGGDDFQTSNLVPDFLSSLFDLNIKHGEEPAQIAELDLTSDVYANIWSTEKHIELNDLRDASNVNIENIGDSNTLRYESSTHDVKANEDTAIERSDLISRDAPTISEECIKAARAVRESSNTKHSHGNSDKEASFIRQEEVASDPAGALVGIKTSNHDISYDIFYELRRKAKENLRPEFVCPSDISCEMDKSKTAWSKGKGDRMGLVTGKFTAAEDQALAAALDLLTQRWGLDSRVDTVKALCSRKTKRGEPESPWLEIASVLPHRQAESVLQRVKRRFMTYKNMNTWTDAEKIHLLSICDQYKNSDGQIEWKVIGDRLNRVPHHCYDLYRHLIASGRAEKMRKLVPMVVQGENIVNSSFKLKGKNKYDTWSKEEDEKLLTLINEATGVRFPLVKIPWKSISHRISGRSPESLCHRYNDCLLPQLGGLNVHKSVKRRTIIRFLTFLIRKCRESIQWREIDWQYCLLWWPKLACVATARQLIVGSIKLGRRLRTEMWSYITNSDVWKRIVLCIYVKLECKKYEKSDWDVLLQYMQRLQELSERDNHLDPVSLLNDKTSFVAQARFVAKFKRDSHKFQHSSQIEEQDCLNQSLLYHLGFVDVESDSVNMANQSKSFIAESNASLYMKLPTARSEDKSNVCTSNSPKYLKSPALSETKTDVGEKFEADESGNSSLIHSLLFSD